MEEVIENEGYGVEEEEEEESTGEDGSLPAGHGGGAADGESISGHDGRRVGVLHFGDLPPSE